MDVADSSSFSSLYDALEYIARASGLRLNLTSILPRRPPAQSLILNLLPLILGTVGLAFNIIALLIFTTSRTFRQSSFHCYIYAFVLVNCATIVT